MEINKVFSKKTFDLIFCRNVFIYFEEDNIFQIVNNFKKILFDKGLLITGISESLKSIKIEKETLAPSVYCFDNFRETEKQEKVVAIDSIRKNTVPEKLVSSIPSPIKMLIVDDSKSVVKLLTKIFYNLRI